MQVKDVFAEVKEVVGYCDESIVFSTITRAVELLANTKLIDPLIGYLEIAAMDGFWIALPRDVKTPLRINIAGNPSFARSRLFEFTMNTDGSVDGEQIGFSWANRGYLPVQDETQFPGNLKYKCASPSDEGRAVTIIGKDEDGREIRESLTAAVTPVASDNVFYEVTSISREETGYECSIICDDEVIARYYPDETRPEYRVIKLSKEAEIVRMIYRKHVFKIVSQEDIIPIHSAMAVIHACKAVKMFADENYANGDIVLKMAQGFLMAEQATRDEADQLAAMIDVAPDTDNNIATRDGLVAADIYDDASSIFGKIGKEGIFDKITTAVEILSNKGEWDGTVGVVDVQKTDQESENTATSRGSGYFVLPRFVEGVISVNVGGNPMIPRNKWFEFHLNGVGEMGRSSNGTFDDQEETVIIAALPIDASTRMVIPQLVAVLCGSGDVGCATYITGLDEDGREVTDLLVSGAVAIAPPSTLFTKITRIKRDATTEPVRFVTVSGTPGNYSEDKLIGWWYPDEIEPKYRAIRVHATSAARVRVRYRKRTAKITSMYQPINLRSRQAVTCMMRAMKLQETDISGSVAMEQIAVRYLNEEAKVSNPNKTGMLQFVSGVMPGVRGNIQ